MVLKPTLLPSSAGVKVALPVLGAKDIEDVQQFACKNDMDLISASFVQSAEDIHFIRKVRLGARHVEPS